MWTLFWCLVTAVVAVLCTLFVIYYRNEIKKEQEETEIEPLIVEPTLITRTGYGNYSVYYRSDNGEIKEIWLSRCDRTKIFADVIGDNQMSVIAKRVKDGYGYISIKSSEIHVRSMADIKFQPPFPS